MFKKKDGIEINPDKIDTIVGKDTVFVGKLNCNGTVRVEGKVEGEINGKGDVVVGETGIVQGNIKARHLTLAGEVLGNLDLTGKLEIISTGKLQGDIRVDSLIIGDGGKFIGNSTMIGDNASTGKTGKERKEQ